MFSVLLMRIIRRILLPVLSWYRKTSFLSGVKSYGNCNNVKGPVYLWNGNVIIGDYNNFYPNVTLWGPGIIRIGSHCEIGIGTTIYSTQKIIIGNDVSVAAGCYIIDSNHNIKKGSLIRQQKAVTKGPVVIEDDVWLGAGVKVLSGVTIKRGAVIGAQAVVTSDIPENAIAVGVPAKVVAFRS